MSMAHNSAERANLAAPAALAAPDFDFTGASVIVTGGTKGLGKGIAQAFLGAGANVVVCARKEPEELPSAGAGEAQAMFVAADVRQPDDIQQVVERTLAAHQRIDVLVNNAGGAPPAASAEASARFNERVVALNLLAPIMFAQAVQPTMNAQPEGGVILNIASEAALRANPFGVAYGAAKAGLINASKTLAVEWAPKIRVLAVTAGLLMTENAHLFYGDEAGVARVGETIALGRMGVPRDIAQVCLFLASPLAGWMTGTSVEVHGGGEKPAYLSASTGQVAEQSEAT